MRIFIDFSISSSVNGPGAACTAPKVFAQLEGRFETRGLQYSASLSAAEKKFKNLNCVFSSFLAPGRQQRLVLTRKSDSALNFLPGDGF